MTYTTFAAAIRPRRALIERVTTLAVAILLSGTAACGGNSDSATAPKADYSGTYSLRSIDQAAPPVKVFDGSATDATTGKWYAQFIVTVNRGTLELDAQGNYRTTFDYTLVEDGVSENRTLRAQGTYAIDVGQIILHRDNGTDTAEGSVKNGEVTLDMTLMGSTANAPFTFRK